MDVKQTTANHPASFEFKFQRAFTVACFHEPSTFQHYGNADSSQPYRLLFLSCLCTYEGTHYSSKNSISTLWCSTIYIFAKLIGKSSSLVQNFQSICMDVIHHTHFQKYQKEKLLFDTFQSHQIKHQDRTDTLIGFIQG